MDVVVVVFALSASVIANSYMFTCLYVFFFFGVFVPEVLWVEDEVRVCGVVWCGGEGV